MAEYQKCIALVDEYEESNSPHPVLTFQKAGCLNNLALCYKNVQQPGKTIHYTTQALKLSDDRNLKIKALLRRAYAFEEKDKLGHAKKDYVAIKMLDPGNMPASKGLHRISQELLAKKQEREAYDQEQMAKGEKANAVTVEDEATEEP